MFKTARFLSVFFHPLFLMFYNLTLLLFFAGVHGASLGFMITFFFLTVVLLPTFITFTILYTDNRNFEWSALTSMQIGSRTKLLGWSVLYQLLVLVILLILPDVILGAYEPMFAFLIMAYIFSMALSFLMHLRGVKISLHNLTAVFLTTSCMVFLWKIPGIQMVQEVQTRWMLIMGSANLLVLLSLIYSRLRLKAHNRMEVIYGMAIGILSPLLLTLLTYGI